MVISPKVKEWATALLLHNGPRFPGLVQNLIMALIEYRRRVVDILDPKDPAVALHLKQLDELLKDLDGWNLEKGVHEEPAARRRPPGAAS